MRLGNRIRRSAREGADGAALHAEATWQLVWRPHERAALDLAIDRLRRAAAQEPDSLPIATDLGAALLLRAQSLDQPLDLARSVEASKAALELGADNPAVLFNLALALDLLTLESEAAAARRRFDELEPDPRWRREAESLGAQPPTDSQRWPEVLAALERSLARDDASGLAAQSARLPLQVRLHLERELLPGWLAAERAGGEAAARRWSEVRALSQALLAGTGDALAADCVAAVEAAARRPDRPALLAALELHVQALELYRTRRYSEAMPLFVESRRALAAAAGPCGEWPDFYAATCAYYLRRYAEARRQLAAQLYRTADRPYPSLRGHVHWMLGLIGHVTGSRSAALAAYTEAISAFAEVGERQNLAAMHNQLANVYGQIGSDEAAWRHRYRALRLHPHQVHAARRITVLTGVVDGLVDDGLTRTATSFQNLQVRLAAEAGDPTAAAVAERRLAELLVALGRRGEALDHLSAAREHLSAIPDAAHRGRVEAHIELAAAEAQAKGAPDSALVHLSRAIEILSAPEPQFEVLDALRRRAGLYRRLERPGAADADLQQAVQQAEWLAGEVVGTDRLRYLDLLRALFDEAIDAATAGGFDERGLRLHELEADLQLRAIAGALGRPDRETSGGTMDLQRAARKLAPQTRIVVLRLLPERLLLWRLDREGLRYFERRLEQGHGSRLESLRAELVAARSPAAFADAVEQLRDLLLGPLWESEDGEGHLVVVPDRNLLWVPFDALLGDGRPPAALTVSHAASIASYERLLERYRRAWRRPPSRLLAVAEPRLDTLAHPRLAGAGAPGAEAESLTSLYGTTELLRDRAATREAILARAGPWDVFHFGGHAVVEPGDGSGLRLAVAGSESAGEIPFLDLRDLAEIGTRVSHLMVLGACRSGLSGRGAFDPAVAALSGRAPLLLVTLWEVDDESAATVLEAFHRGIAAGAPPAVALRDAKRGHLRRMDEERSYDSSWAAFQLVGGVETTG